MKSVSIMLYLFFIVTSAFAESDENKKAFAKLKALEGVWEGTVTTSPAAPGVEGMTSTVTFRVASMGNILMHDMKSEGRPDNPLTVFYLDEAGLLLTHYCDAGNRPRMSAKTSPDGNTIEFDFIDVAGGTKHGYMRRAVFTFVDADHHIEEWTYMMPGERPMRARVELKRVTGSGPATAASAAHRHGL